MQWFVDNYIDKLNINNKLKVLDVGSYDVNGSYRHLFSDEYFKYYGLDMEAGPNVDLVLNNPYQWNELGTDSFDIVIGLDSILDGGDKIDRDSWSKSALSKGFGKKKSECVVIMDLLSKKMLNIHK